MSAKNILTTGVTTGGIGLIATVLTSKLLSMLITLIGSIVVVEGVEMLKVGSDIVFSLDTAKTTLLVAMISLCGAAASYLKGLYDKYIMKK